MGSLIPFIQKELFPGEYHNNIDNRKDVGKATNAAKYDIQKTKWLWSKHSCDNNSDDT